MTTILLVEDDALALDATRRAKPGARLKIAVPILPHIANFDDLDPLDAEPAVDLVRVRPGEALPGDADLVILALGFIGPEKPGLVADLGLKLDHRGHVHTDGERMTSVPGVFAAGDMVRGQSLVVWAINEGRRAARGVDRYLMHGETALP